MISVTPPPVRKTMMKTPRLLFAKVRENSNFTKILVHTFVRPLCFPFDVTLKALLNFVGRTFYTNFRQMMSYISNDNDVALIKI